MAGFSQEDSTKTPRPDSTGHDEKVDTIKIGGMVIIKRHDGKEHSVDVPDIIISNNKHRKNSNIRTNWMVLDLGFANFNDQSNYANAAASGFIADNMNEDNFDLRNGKSVNVGIWFFLQRLNLIQHVVNLKYGLGLDLNNYRFEDERLQLNEHPASGEPNISLNENWKGIKKNKLAADYITVPLMLNFNFTPNNDKGFSLSAGVSAGYLYSSRQKIKDDGERYKFHDNFELRQWKLAYVGELGLGPVKLYGSYAMESMWEKGLDHTPYNMGIRFSAF
jgi:hypothetical protein